MAGSNRNASRNASLQMAFCGLLCALAVTLMMAGGLIPIATYCTPMAAGILLLPILAEYGKRSAWTAYAAIAIISLVLGVDKEASFFFVAIGYYPILKWDIDRIRQKPIRVLIKILLFNITIGAMYSILIFLLHMDAVSSDFAEMGTAFTVLFFVTMTGCMLVYDRLIIPLLLIYAKKLRPKFRFLNRN